MAGARVVVKGGFISNGHAANTLIYAGEKISKQVIEFITGATLEIASDKKINLKDYGEENINNIFVTFKDGKEVSFDVAKYESEISNKLTFSEVKELIGDDDKELPDEKEIRNMADMDLKKYFKYIANRKGVSKNELGESCFGLENMSTDKALKMLTEDYSQSIKWSYIISINPEDAAALGYDKRKAWEDLVKANAPKIAKAYNISLENLVINAFYHDNKPHKHIHMVFYSKNPNEGFLQGGKEHMTKATKTLKSTFLNGIFKDEVAEIKELINVNRKNSNKT